MWLLPISPWSMCKGCWSINIHLCSLSSSITYYIITKSYATNLPIPILQLLELLLVFYFGCGTIDVMVLIRWTSLKWRIAHFMHCLVFDKNIKIDGVQMGVLHYMLLAQGRNPLIRWQPWCVNWYNSKVHFWKGHFLNMTNIG